MSMREVDVEMQGLDRCSDSGISAKRQKTGRQISYDGHNFEANHSFSTDTACTYGLALTAQYRSLHAMV